MLALYTSGLEWLQGGRDALQSQQATLKTHCHTTPQAMAAWLAGDPLVLTPPQPYAGHEVLHHLGRDAQNSSEKVVDNIHYRLFYTASNALVTLKACWVNEQWLVEVGLLADAAQKSLGKAQAFAARWEGMVRGIHILGLGQPYAPFAQLAAKHPAMAPLLQRWPGLRAVQCVGVWEALCWGIMGQQINLAFAYQLRNQLMVMCAKNLWGDSVANHGFKALKAGPWQSMLPFPNAEALLEVLPQQWRAARFSRQKTRYLQALAQAFVAKQLDEYALQAMDDDTLVETLCGYKGIGPWTAAYAMLRGLGRMNAIPVGDAGLRKALKTAFGLEYVPNPQQQAQLLAAFAPYSGLATTYLWRSLKPT